MYWECQPVGKTLINNIVEVVDKKYLDTLCNPDTDMIDDPFSTKIDYLQRENG